ncbi:hypothetical protein F5878DRAFT_189070 [Lentinula raphanica]|uniref:Uncharacterized protein n=1 Tax=Lentinula raphanica TaxID=153919 RepID=A0AA38UEG2_9AGAR|nr:hypothetical protein F5878DRAFT_189070 [Lentinula raphanica]
MGLHISSPRSSLRPFVIVSLAVCLLSLSTVAIARPLNYPEEPQAGSEIEGHVIVLSEVVTFSNDKHEDTVGTGAVFLNIGPEHLHIMGPTALTAQSFVSRKIIGHVSYVKGKGDAVFTQARTRALEFAYPLELGSINYWRYLRNALGLLCSHSLFMDQTLETFNTEMNKALSIVAGQEIILIEYVTLQQRHPSGELALSIGGTTIFLTKPIDPETRFSRQHTIGKIQEDAKPVDLEKLYHYAATHTQFQDENTDLLKTWQMVEEEWRKDADISHKPSTQDLTKWRFAEGIMNALSAEHSIGQSTLTTWQKTRTDCINVYLNYVEGSKNRSRERAARNKGSPAGSFTINRRPQIHLPSSKRQKYMTDS